MYVVEPTLIAHIRGLYPDAVVTLAEGETDLVEDMIITVHATAFPFGGGRGVRWLVDFMVFVWQDHTKAMEVSRNIVKSMDAAVDTGSLGKIVNFTPSQLPSLVPNMTASQGHVAVGFIAECHAHYH